MSELRYPCITYTRTREFERQADQLAGQQQLAAEQEIERKGVHIVSRFMDTEFAEPFCGWLEPRGGWQLALAEAKHVASTQGGCNIIILRADGIGGGDMFLPELTCLDGAPGVDIAVSGFCLSAKASITSLRSAHALFERHKADERKSADGSIIRLRPSLSANEIVFERHNHSRSARAYFANVTGQELRLQWQSAERPLLQNAEWPQSSEWHDLAVPAHSGRYLQTFFQGECRPTTHYWEFESGAARGRRVGNIVITPLDLTRQGMPLRWYAYEPS